MRGKEGKKQNKFMRFVGAPLRFLSKARDFYVKSMFDCVRKTGNHSNLVCPAPPLPRNPSFNTSFSSSASSNDTRNEDLRELIRVASKRDVESRSKLGMSFDGVGRSYSVGVGRIGRIDEDKTCEFEEEDVQPNNNIITDDFLYPRSRSYAVRRRNIARQI